MHRIVRVFAVFNLMALLIVSTGLGSTEARLQDFAELVPIYNAEGDSIRQIYLVSPYDPFEVVEPGNDLEPGTHHVLLEAGFINTGSEPLPYDPDVLLLVDSNGFTYQRTIINNLTADSTNYFTEAGTVPPSEDFYGDSAYVIPDGAVIERIIYATEGSHISAYDGRAAKNPVGTAVQLKDVAGSPVGQIGVVSITDPFEASAPPAAGTRFVAVELMISPQGQQGIAVTATDFLAVDELGRLVEPAAVAPLDPGVVALTEGDVAPGATAQGVLVYQVPENNAIARIVWTDGGTRDLVLADVEIAASTSDSTGGCGGFVEWALSSLGAAGTVNTFLMNLQGASPQALDAGMLSIYYQQSESALEQVRQAVPPPAVESTHEYVIAAFLEPGTAALETLMNAVAAGDYATAQSALDEMTALLTLFSPGGEGDAVMSALPETCPEEYQELLTMGG